MVRAKFRCNSITLRPASAYTPEFAALYQEHGYQEAAKLAAEQGIEQSRTYDEPTVALTAVVGDGSEENRAFWNATPNGSISMTINNPDAAETFELGKEYYVDFSPAALPSED